MGLKNKIKDRKFSALLFTKKEKAALQNFFTTKITRLSSHTAEVIIKVNALRAELGVFLARRINNNIQVFKVINVEKMGEITIED